MHELSSKSNEQKSFTGVLAKNKPSTFFNPLVQPKLTINQPDDVYEQEADAMADKVMRMPDSAVSDNLFFKPAISSIQRKCVHCEEEEKKELQRKEISEDEDLIAETAIQAKHFQQSAAFVQKKNNNSENVQQALQSGGTRLDANTRSFMEERFGYDFGNVQIHNGSLAHTSSAEINAQAFTHKNHIVFGSGYYQPNSSEGKKLLAHELTHVIQQNNNIHLKYIQRKPAGIPVLTFHIKVPAIITRDAFINAMYRQAYGVTDVSSIIKGTWTGVPSDAELAAMAGKEKTFTIQKDLYNRNISKLHPELNAGGDSPENAAADKKRQDDFAKLSPELKRQINNEIDKQFYARSGQQKDDKITGKTSPDAHLWNQIQSEVLKQKEIIDNMSPSVKDLFKGPLVISPENYKDVARIASKLSQLSDTELADYKNKINAAPADIATFENAIDLYMQNVAKRKEETNIREAIKTKLYGTGDLYDKYKQWKLQKESASALTHTRGVTGELAKSAWDKVNTMQTELEDALKKAGFPGGITEFDQKINEFEAAFELESKRIANDILDKFEHKLYEAETKYSKDAEVDSLYQSLSTSNSKADYELGDKIRSEHAQIPYTPDEVAEQSYWIGKRNEAIASGASKVRALANAHPIVGMSKFDIEALGRASSKEVVRSIINNYIKARRDDIKTSRENLKDKPALVYKADELLKKSYEIQEIQPNSIYDKIIQDKVKNISLDEMLVKALVAVLAIALGIITMGGGTVGVLAAAGAFGISAYQAVEEYKEYETKQGLSGVGLISDDPSLAWVIVSVIAAGVDLGVAVSTVKAIVPAAKAFNATHDFATLEKSLAQLSEIDSKIKVNVLRAAESELKYKAAVKNLFTVGTDLKMVIVPGGEEFFKLVVVAYYGLKRGIISFEKFLLELKIQNLIKNADALSPEELTVLKQAFEKARTTPVAEMESGLQKLITSSADTPGVYTTKIKWGILDVEARPYGDIGFWGKRTAQANPRVDAFELKINPNNESIYIKDSSGSFVQFENIQAGTLQDGKLLLKPQGSIYRVLEKPEFLRKSILEEATRQVNAAKVHGFQVEWLVSDNEAVRQLTKYLSDNNIAITVKFLAE